VKDQSETQVNSIRPLRVASLQAIGEARTGAIWRPVTLRGSVLKRSRDAGGWLESEWSEGLAHEAERPARVQAVFIVPDRDTKSRRAGVRTPIVASNPGNSGGAKGRREMDEERS
jgi:hypothetical protein